MEEEESFAPERLPFPLPVWKWAMALFEIIFMRLESVTSGSSVNKDCCSLEAPRGEKQGGDSVPQLQSRPPHPSLVPTQPLAPQALGLYCVHRPTQVTQSSSLRMVPPAYTTVQHKSPHRDSQCCLVGKKIEVFCVCVCVSLSLYIYIYGKV